MFLLYQILANSIRLSLWFWGLFSSKKSELFNQRTSYKKQNSTLPTLWFHASSYGEFEGILPIITHASEEGTHFILCSFFSPSGFIPLKDHPLVDQVVYLPFDTKKDVAHFLKEFSPSTLIISQNEYWPQMIRSCLDSQIPVYYVGTYIRPNHWWLSKSKTHLSSKLKEVSAIFLQDELSFKLLAKAGFKNIEITGNPRVDQAIQNAIEKKSYPILQDFANRKPLLVCGSTLAKDEAIILAYIKETDDLNVLLVPHDPATFDYDQLQAFSWIRYSEIKHTSAPEVRIIVLDTIGDLKYVYAYGSLAYVGGGFDAGVHSVLEPAVFNIVILTGPNISKFNSAVELHELKCLVTIDNQKELTTAISKMMSQGNNEIESNLKRYITTNAGASKEIWDSIRLSILN